MATDSCYELCSELIQTMCGHFHASGPTIPSRYHDIFLGGDSDDATHAERTREFHISRSLVRIYFSGFYEA